MDKTILRKISKESGINNFWLGGSITYLEEAKKIGIKFKCMDYDLAIIGSEIDFEYTKKILKKNKFKIIQERPYFLRFKKIFQIIAKKGDLLLDIAILDNLKYLGHFNWERIFWEYPSGRIYDPYHALASISKKRLKLTIPLKEENPLILASRFSKLCARFDLDPNENPYLNKLAGEMSNLVKNWKSKDAFHGKYAKEHAYFGVLESILRSQNKFIFTKRLEQSGILRAFFPEMNKDLTLNEKNIKKINSIRDISKLVFFFEEFFIEKKKIKQFKEKMNLISSKLKKY